MFPQAAPVLDWFDQNSGVTKTPFLGSLGSIFNGITGSGLTGAQVEQNEFNAEQAQIARDWEQQVYNNKFQWSVNDMSSAGLNPAMMYGGSINQASAPSSGAASGSSVAAPQMASLFSSIASLMQAQTAKDKAPSEIKKNEADAGLSTTQSELNTKNLGWIDPLNNKYIEQVNAIIDNLKADKDLKLSEKQVNDIEGQFLDLQRIYQGMQNETYEQIQETLVSMASAQLDLITAQKNNQDKQAALYEQQIEESAAKIGQIYAETARAKAEARVKSAEVELVEANILKVISEKRLLEKNAGLVDSQGALNWAQYDKLLTENKQLEYEVATEIGKDLYGRQATMSIVTGYWNAVNNTMHEANAFMGNIMSRGASGGVSSVLKSFGTQSTQAPTISAHPESPWLRQVTVDSRTGRTTSTDIDDMGMKIIRAFVRNGRLAPQYLDKEYCLKHINVVKDILVNGKFPE